MITLYRPCFDLVKTYGFFPQGIEKIRHRANWIYLKLKDNISCGHLIPKFNTWNNSILKFRFILFMAWCRAEWNPETGLDKCGILRWNNILGRSVKIIVSWSGRGWI